MDNNNSNFINPGDLSEAEQRGMALKGQIAAGMSQHLFSMANKLETTATDTTEEFSKIRDLLGQYQSTGEQQVIDFPYFNKIIMGLGPPGQFDIVLQLNLTDYSDFHTCNTSKVLVCTKIELDKDNKLSVDAIFEPNAEVSSVSVAGTTVSINHENGLKTSYTIEEALEKYPANRTDDLVHPEKIGWTVAK